MKLKNTSKEVIIKVKTQDVEDLIFETYGHRYEICSMEEVGSGKGGDAYEINVSTGQLDEAEKDEILALREGRPYQYSIRTIMKDLCNMECIDEGNYLIDVSW